METTKELIAAAIWLTLLTIGVVRLFVANRAERKALRQSIIHLEHRLTQVDLKEAMGDLMHLIRQRNIHADARLREGVERLIARMEADPLTADHYRVDLTALKEAIR